MNKHLDTTPITGTIHADCGAAVLFGLAEGLTAWVDLTALNQAGEIAAILAGLQTYTLARSGLIHRDAGRIAGTSLRDRPVLAEHQCHRLIPADHRTTTTPPARTAVTDVPAY